MKILTAAEVKIKQLEKLQIELANINGVPKLQIIVVGDNQASTVYVRNKVNFAKEIGFDCDVRQLEASITEQELLAIIEEYNQDETIHGLFVQLPIPEHIDSEKVIKAIKAEKDIDGFTLENIGKLFINDESGLVPCTVQGIIDLLDYYEIETAGKNVVIVGRSNIVGKPLAIKMINAGATVTVCNSRTKDLKKQIETADIFISAIGQAKFFDQTYFTNKQELVIIDVGMNRDQDGKLCGDVDFEAVKEQVAAITPVPGGVGVMTHVSVAFNVLKAYKTQKGE